MYLIHLLITIAVLGTCLAVTVPQTRGVSDSDQQVIVDAHNAYRRAVSPSATNMRKMYWNDNLASAAQYFVDKCIQGHDDNAERRQRSNIGVQVGQNFAGNYNWDAAIKGWYDEVKYYDFNTGKSNTTGEDVGHYTQVVWAKSSLVGCGMKACAGLNYYVCNYAYGNMNGQNVYEMGSSCAACSAENRCDDKLCDCPNGKICQHGGVLNLNDCSCTCQNGWTGDECQTCPASDPSYCGKEQPYGYPQSFCPLFSNVPDACPYMCEVCE